MSTSKINSAQRNGTAGLKDARAGDGAARPANTVLPGGKAEGKALGARAAPDASGRPVGGRDTSSFETLSRKGGSAVGAAAAVAVNKAPRSVPVKRTVTLVYDAGPHSKLTNLQVKGSWDASGKYSAQWNERPLAMKPLGEGRWGVTVELSDDGLPHDWEWGVIADGPSGKGQWAVMGEGNLKLDVTKPTASYAPTTYHKMGARRSGEDAAFTFYAGNARSVQVKVTDRQGRVERFPMTRDEEGNWSTQVPGRWKDLLGKSYVYEVVDSAGATSERPDPYAREMMGEQRGLDRMYLDARTGQEVNRYASGARELMRFDIDDHGDAESAYLVLKDANGRTLKKDELLARLGDFDTTLVDKLRAGGANDFWSKNIEADGRIRMTNQGGAWTTLVNDPAKLVGLRYEFQVYEKDAQGRLKLRHDGNGDGRLSDAERVGAPINDPWSDRITEGSGVTFRGSVITDPASFEWKHDSVPREKDQAKWVVYQLHAGSFLGKGGNANRSTLEDLTAKLDYFKKLGVNTLELLPVNEVEGARNWGYLGVNSLATESALGFEDENGRWVSGPEAMKRFIDEAHKKGLNVISDVVYNHVFGDYNGLWNVGGEDNPYFNWAQDTGGYEQRETPWGAVPAYSNPKVKQFFVDHAVAQMEELHFDGLRFDFTEPIKGTGGQDGWELLREINRQVHYYNPDAWTVAEQFDYDPSITQPARADGTGGGFDAQWYTEFQHRLVRDNDKPGIIQAAARGMKTDMDAFMSMLTNPRGLDGWKSALSIISNHDEVGNAERTMNTAEGATPTEFPDQWSRGAARFAAGIGMAGPGIPMFFQGDEFGAQNDFRWGNPSTWDSDWDWASLGKDWNWEKVTFNDARKKDYERLYTLTPEKRVKDAAYQGLSAEDRKVFESLAALPAHQRTDAMLDITKKQSFRFYRDAIALRQSSPAFRADAEVKRVYTHNDDSVMAFTRKSGGEEYLVVGSMNRQNLEGYALPLPPGNWKEVLNSDAAAYGGGNFGNGGGTLGGGNTKVNIPAAGYVVLKRV
ncbi:alpha-amylase family glycosyl hydrolase [Cystobacter ferrugineus]|uniref:alpha-amylase family glycosyl hydrolase n=1 Tax=Cystobacter ferrugineus TaxID=83449 RepID=UPI0009031209|nr:alpha-amylase family glycosyl hydrolase [Cystobacter ferrugineus]